MFGFLFQRRKTAETFKSDFLRAHGVPVDTEGVFPEGGTVRHTILVEGDTVCRHSYVKVPWDRSKLGPDVETPGEDQITETSGFFATFKNHWRCSKCSREVIREDRDLL